MTHEEGIRIALKEAETALEQDEVPVGAVLVKNEQVISKAHNLCRSLNDPTAHAEILAIRDGYHKIGGPLKDCTLYVTLEPCAMCACAAVHCGLGSIVFGAFDPVDGCCGSLIDITDHWLSGSVLTCGGVLENECSRLLSSFFQNKR